MRMLFLTALLLALPGAARADGRRAAGQAAKAREGRGREGRPGAKAKPAEGRRREEALPEGAARRLPDAKAEKPCEPVKPCPID